MIGQVDPALKPVEKEPRKKPVSAPTQLPPMEELHALDLGVKWFFAITKPALVRGSPPTRAHFGPKKGCTSGSLFKKARCNNLVCVLYYSVI